MYDAIACVTVKFCGYSFTNTMIEKWKNLKAATAFQIFFVCTSNRLVLRKKSQLYCQLLGNIYILRFV